jgi:hypothetical protein
MQATSIVSHHRRPNAAKRRRFVRTRGSTPLTAVRPATPAPAAEGRVPRRVRPPRWLDLRLVLGVLLVLGSVLIGARVVTAAGATVPVWAASADLAAGTVLHPGDVVAVQVRLEKSSDSYLATSVPLDGRVLSHAVRQGELLPRSAVEQPQRYVQVALPVQAGYVPPGLARGQLVDVYALASSSGAATSTSAGSVALVVAAAPVQDLSGRAAGVLSAPTTTVQVVVSVPADAAARVLGAIGGRPLAVVVHPSVEAATPTASVAAGPTG